LGLEATREPAGAPRKEHRQQIGGESANRAELPEQIGDVVSGRSITFATRDDPAEF
jgi:hypothetical protein